MQGMRLACNAARQTLPDQGTEFGIGSYVDVLPEFLRKGGMKDLGTVAPEDTLFPLALETP
eukprot:9338859-Lingulodinium_polyedra.AAC.1